MIFSELSIPGAFLVELERIEDERGFFARTFCRNEFLKLGLSPAVEQCSLSFNKKKGTLRGMHYQEDPHAETKIEWSHF
jgi:dTDP-4-dehydrorhamnose 3,5-epimerase